MAETNTDEQVLKELRKLNRFMRLSITFMAAVVVYIIFMPYYIGKMKPAQTKKEPSWTWEKVNDLTDKGNYYEAEIIGINLLQKTPKDYYSNGCLAALYLRKGDLTQAIKYAGISYQLFPNKSNEETLQGIE